MRKYILSTAAVAAFASIVTTADAASLQVIGGTFGSIPTFNEANDGLAPLFGAGTTSYDGYYGAQLALTGTANLKFTVFGMEADDFNSIMYGQTFDAAGNPQNFIGLGNPDPANTNVWDPNGLGSFMVSNVAAGLIDFSFANIAGFAKADNSSNGYAIANALPNFFLSIAGNAAATVGNSVWMFLDDSGGNGPNGGPNGDYDDLIVRMDVIPTTAPVPLPAAGVLLVGALGGLGLMRRRRTA